MMPCIRLYLSLLVYLAWVSMDLADNFSITSNTNTNGHMFSSAATQTLSTTSSTIPTYYPSLSPHSISVISTIAGTGTAGYSGDNGQATSAAINSPHGIDVDASGNVYFNDHVSHRVRKITASSGIITTYAGTGSTTYNGDGGVASSAALYNPNGLCLDTAGNLYIADQNNHRIRKVLASTNVISTIAGTGAGSYSGDNGQATSATLNYVAGVAVDASGNVYIGDLYNHRVRKITASTSVITTIAGNGVSGFSGDNGQATAANIQYPVGINLDNSQNVYFGDHAGYNVIRKITISTGVISTVAGTGSASGGYNGDNIQATAVMLNYPHDVVLDSYGNLYITDSLNNRIRKVDVLTGVITTVVGTGTASSSGDGFAATSATVNLPCYIRVDSSGNYYVSECNGNRIRKVITVSTDIPTTTPTKQPTYYPSLSPHSISVISTIAGTGAGSYSGDNDQATAASLNLPHGIVIDSNGNVFFSDLFNFRVRKITVSTGIITTYAGTGSASYSGDGGVASSAALYNPNGLSLDTSGNLYIADQMNNRIRKVLASTSVISTIAGTGSTSFSGDNGLATSATLYYPVGVAVDASGNVYIGDSTNNRVRKITASTGVITTIAGNGVEGFSGDGGAATSANIKNPCGVNLDNSLNVYFGSDFYNVIRKITVSTGIISTVAGTGSTSGGYNGDNIQATSAMLNGPVDVVFDSYNNLYISDRFNYRVRKVDVSTGLITTVLGTGTASSTGDGSAATAATIKGACYCRFDSSGNYYISECDGCRIRKVITVSTEIPTTTPTKQPTYYPSLSPHSISVISTIAGTGTASYSGDNGPATSATINSPHGIDIDSSGNLYFNDYYNNRVRKITASTGIISTYAGTGSTSYNGDGGVATSAALYYPNGLCLDTSGNLYIAEQSNHRIRKVLASTSVISTIAGTGTASYSGDNGQATSATLNIPVGVAVDTSGNVYFADQSNNRIRKITASTGVITTIAGTGIAGFNGNGGSATAANIANPVGVNLDSSVNVYFSDGTYNVIRKITVSTGIISTVAGTGSTTGGYNGDNIQATSASFNYPHDVVFDSYGNLYISDLGNYRIRKVDTSTGLITTIIGNGSASSTGDGSAATSATIKGVCYSRFDSSGNYYVSECDGHRVRKVVTVSTEIPTTVPSYTPSIAPTFVPSTAAPTQQPTYYPSLSPHSISIISTIAGTGTGGYSGDGGVATSAAINEPHGIAFDSSGNVYFNEFCNHRMRKITASTGIITTYAGTGSASYSGDGGKASSAALSFPVGLCIDASDNIYIADYGNHRIRKVTASTSVISTIAGTGTNSYSGDNGQATSATINKPIGVAVDTSGNVYIGDSNNHRVRKITAASSVISTIAGTGTAGYSGDGGQATAAATAYPGGINLDSSLNVYFSDWGGAYNVIRKITVSTGIISTVAGTGSTTGGYNGDNIQATAAMLNVPYDVVLDSYNNLYIVDEGNNRIRKVDVSTGLITTIVGTGSASSTGDGSAASSATINHPKFSRFDSAGNLYITEWIGNRVRKVVTVSTEIPTTAPSYTPSTTPSTAPSKTPTSYPSLSPHSISVITTIAGTGATSYSGDGEIATSAAINSPHGIDVDASGNVYFSDQFNHRVRKITASTGIITTYAGTGSGSFSGDGGTASSATLQNPNGLCLDTAGNVYITDQSNYRIRKVLASNSVISTIAGTGSTTYSGDNGQATSATLNYPVGVAVDTSGNVYIGDLINHRVRKITASTSIITTIAGKGVSGFSGDGGAATAANIAYPVGINLDSSQNVYFGDHAGYNVIRKITVSTGIISTVAGVASTSGVYNGDNIQATAASLNYPHDIVLDSYGNLYITDSFNNRVRKVAISTGVITTVVGTGTSSSSGDGSAATSATIYNPGFIRFDSAGNLYITEGSGQRVRKVVTVSTEIPTTTPTKQPTYYPSLSPHSISIISTIAGTGTASYSGDNGPATSATIYAPGGIAIDSSGNVYFNEFGNSRMRKITVSTGIITTYAGTGSCNYNGDGIAATSAALCNPEGLAIDSSGDIYLADFSNHRVRKITVSTSIISTIAGTGTASFSGDNGPATSAGIYGPIGIDFDTPGNVYFTDYSNHRVRKITVSTGIINTIAGTGAASYSGDNGPATAATLYYPCGLTVDSSDNVYIADYVNHRIRKITASTGVITSLAGTGSTAYNGDGIAATSASLYAPHAVILDSYGNLFIADRYHHRIRKVTISTGMISTVVGTGSASSSGDGAAASAAAINAPFFCAFDSSYILD